MIRKPYAEEIHTSDVIQLLTGRVTLGFTQIVSICGLISAKRLELNRIRRRELI